MRRHTPAAALPAILLLSLLACEAEKSSSPLSPSVAGPIPGVSITPPKLLEPAQGNRYGLLVSWSISGTYLESCNCDAICPCRRVGGRAGGRSTYGVCEGALSWAIERGHAGDVDLGGLAAVLALRYDDDEPGSPWDFFLYVDERGDERQRAALEAILTGARGRHGARAVPVGVQAEPAARRARGPDRGRAPSRAGLVPRGRVRRGARGRRRSPTSSR